MTTVLVLGGYGAVGQCVVAEMRRSGYTAIVAGRDAARADRAVDLLEPHLRSYRNALAGVDVVVNASGVEDARLAAATPEHGPAFIDISANTAYLDAIEQLHPIRPVLLSVGLAPGLTNLLAADAHRAAPGPIDLAVVLGSGEKHGHAATDWTYNLLGRHFCDPSSGAHVRNFTHPTSFTLPELGRRRLFRADFSDQHVLSRDLGTPVRTYFGLDSRAATAALAALTWLPGASHGPRNVPTPGGDGWLVAARGGDGRQRWARGRGQSRGTALIVAAVVGIAAGLPSGVHHLHRVLSLAQLIDCPGIEFDPATHIDAPNR